MVMTKDKLVKIKEINLSDAIQNYIQRFKNEAKDEESSNKADDLEKWLNKDNGEYKQYMDNNKSKIKFQINDNMDIAVGFYQNDDQAAAAG